jgi:DNA repair protein RecO (recombination protein O)
MAQRAIVRTEAVVLRSIDYGETSQIVTLFTEKRGKMAVMAKGARRTKSSFGSSLQPMSYTEVVFYYKPTRTLQILSESTHAIAFNDIRRSLEKITVGLRVVEIVRNLMEEEDAQPAVFDLLRQTLARLNTAETRVANLWPFFQLRMARVLGVAPAIERDDVEAVTSPSGWVSLEDGSVHPDDATPRMGHRTSRAALRAYAVFARADLETVMRMALSDDVRREVEELVEAFMEYHFEEAYPARSREVVGRLLSGTTTPSVPSPPPDTQRPSS